MIPMTLRRDRRRRRRHGRRRPGGHGRPGRRSSTAASAERRRAVRRRRGRAGRRPRLRRAARRGRRRRRARPRATPGVPTVVVDDPVAALGRAGPARRSTALPDVTRARAHRLAGQDRHQGLPRPGARRRRRRRSRPPASQQRARRAAHRAARRRATPAYLVVEMGARGIGHIADLCAIAPPDVAAVLNVGTAHLGEFGSPRGDRAGQGRARRGAAGRRHRRAQRRRPAGRRDGRRAPRPGCSTFGERAAPTSRSADVELDDLGRPVVRARRTAASGARCALRLARRAPGRQRRRRRRDGARRSGSPLDDVADGAERGRGRPRAGGWSCTSAPTGWSSSTTPTTPTPPRCAAALDALAAIGAARPGARTVAVLGEMLELGDVGARGARRGRADCAARLGVDVARRRSGSAAAAIAPGRARSRARLGRRVGPRRRTATRRVDWLRENVVGRGRRPGEGVAGRPRSSSVADGLLTDGADRGRSQPMRAILLGGGLALLISLLGTRVRDPACCHATGYGQEIRDDGPTTHHTKRGTPDHGRPGHHPVASVLAYFAGQADHPGARRRASALLLLFLFVGLGAGRLPRRLHQDLQAAQPRPAQQGEDDRPDRRRRWSSACLALSPALEDDRGQTPASHAHLVHPRLRRLRAADRRRGRC